MGLVPRCCLVQVRTPQPRPFHKYQTEQPPQIAPKTEYSALLPWLSLVENVHTLQSTIPKFSFRNGIARFCPQSKTRLQVMRQTSVLRRSFVHQAIPKQLYQAFPPSYDFKFTPTSATQQSSTYTTTGTTSENADSHGLLAVPRVRLRRFSVRIPSGPECVTRRIGAPTK